MSILHEEIIKHFIGLSGLLYVVLDKEGKILMLNSFALKILGYTENELLGQNWFDKCVPEDRKDEVWEVYEKVVERKMEEIEYFENEVLTKGGERRIISWHNGSYINEAGEVVGSISAGEDVTSKKKVEMELRERIDELDKLNKLMVGRELKMAELKKKVLESSSTSDEEKQEIRDIK